MASQFRLETVTNGDVERIGLDYGLTWGADVSLRLEAVREDREGLRGELTIAHPGLRRRYWGLWRLQDLTQRQALARDLTGRAPTIPWRELLDHAAWEFVQAIREPAPRVVLTGARASPARILIPEFLVDSDPTIIFADGQSGKSWLAALTAVVVGGGITTGPARLQPTRATGVLYLDWETSSDTLNDRVGLLAAGLNVPVPPIEYRRMTRPLAGEIRHIAAACDAQAIGLLIVDSMVPAMGGGSDMWHEAVIRFYEAIRLLGLRSTLIATHVTGADARAGSSGRPFGGAFAYNLPRLAWEAARDPDVDDRLAMIVTGRKWNNLSRRPAPFGLQFVEDGPDRIVVRPWEVAHATASTLPHRTRLRQALATEAKDVRTLAAELGVTEANVRTYLARSLRRKRPDGQWTGDFVAVAKSRPQLWALAAGVTP